jgi:aminopeptidase N
VWLVVVNGTTIDKPDYNGSTINIAKEHLCIGRNLVVVGFASQYDSDGNGCMSYIDHAGRQYLYTQFAPYYANRVLPMFDQPDLKGTMTLNVVAPRQWRVLSNEQSLLCAPFSFEEYLINVNTTNKLHLSKFL